MRIHGDYGWQGLFSFHSFQCKPPSPTLYRRRRSLIQDIYSIRYEWVTRIRNEKPVKNRFIRCETLLWQHLLHFVTLIEWNKEWWWNTNKCKYIKKRVQEREWEKTRKKAPANKLNRRLIESEYMYGYIHTSKRQTQHTLTLCLSCALIK